MAMAIILLFAAFDSLVCVDAAEKTNYEFTVVNGRQEQRITWPVPNGDVEFQRESPYEFISKLADFVVEQFPESYACMTILHVDADNLVTKVEITGDAKMDVATTGAEMPDVFVQRPDASLSYLSLDEVAELKFQTKA